MRKVVLCVAVSLDGFIEGPKGEFDWCFADQDYGMAAFFKRIDAIFMGRKSYEMASKMEGENPWKGITTYVFSNTLKEITSEDTILVSGDIVSEVKAIKNTPGKDIWLFGGASLSTTLSMRILSMSFGWLFTRSFLEAESHCFKTSMEERI